MSIPIPLRGDFTAYQLCSRAYSYVDKFFLTAEKILAGLVDGLVDRQHDYI
jgi:hypothetical protein